MFDLFTYSPAAPLSEEREVALIAAAQAGDEDATLRLLEAYGPALRSAVSTFANGVKAGRSPWAGDLGTGTASFDLEDVQSAALAGLLAAIREHDPARNPRLAGAVRRRIARELADLYAATMPFAIPERTLSRFYGILREAEGDASAAEALAPTYGMSESTFREVYAAVRLTESLDLPVDEATPSARRTASPVFAESPVVDLEDRMLVDLAFRAVDDEEARIVELAYGFTEYEPVADAEIAHRLGQTRPTVQRKRVKALGKMRKTVGASEGGLA